MRSQASYKQDMDFKTLRWGMMGANIDVAPVTHLK